MEFENDMLITNLVGDAGRVLVNMLTGQALDFPTLMTVSQDALFKNETPLDTTDGVAISGFVGKLCFHTLAELESLSFEPLILVVTGYNQLAAVLPSQVPLDLLEVMKPYTKEAHHAFFESLKYDGMLNHDLVKWSGLTLVDLEKWFDRVTLFGDLNMVSHLNAAETDAYFENMPTTMGEFETLLMMWISDLSLTLPERLKIILTKLVNGVLPITCAKTQERIEKENEEDLTLYDKLILSQHDLTIDSGLMQKFREDGMDFDILRKHLNPALMRMILTELVYPSHDVLQLLNKYVPVRSTALYWPFVGMFSISFATLWMRIYIHGGDPVMMPYNSDMWLSQVDHTEAIPLLNLLSNEIRFALMLLYTPLHFVLDVLMRPRLGGMMSAYDTTLKREIELPQEYHNIHNLLLDYYHEISQGQPYLNTDWDAKCRILELIDAGHFDLPYEWLRCALTPKGLLEWETVCKYSYGQDTSPKWTREVTRQLQLKIFFMNQIKESIQIMSHDFVPIVLKGALEDVNLIMENAWQMEFHNVSPVGVTGSVAWTDMKLPIRKQFMNWIAPYADLDETYRIDVDGKVTRWGMLNIASVTDWQRDVPIVLDLLSKVPPDATIFLRTRHDDRNKLYYFVQQIFAYGGAVRPILALPDDLNITFIVTKVNKEARLNSRTGFVIKKGLVAVVIMMALGLVLAFFDNLVLNYLEIYNNMRAKADKYLLSFRNAGDGFEADIYKANPISVFQQLNPDKRLVKGKYALTRLIGRDIITFKGKNDYTRLKVVRPTQKGARKRIGAPNSMKNL